MRAYKGTEKPGGRQKRAVKREPPLTRVVSYTARQSRTSIFLPTGLLLSATHDTRFSMSFRCGCRGSRMCLLSADAGNVMSVGIAT